MRSCAVKSFPLRPSVPRDLKRGRSRAGPAGAHEVGMAVQTDLRYRHRTLPELRRRFEDHRPSFDTLLRTGIEDPTVSVKILRHLGLPSGAISSPARSRDFRAAPDPAIQDPNKAATLTQLSCA